jgi:glutamate racemase
MSLPCPLFVPMVEEGWLEEAETKRIARHYLSPLRMAAVDTLILGCTHYPLLSPVIQRYMGSKVKLIDSGAAVVSRLLSQLPDRDQGGVQQFYLTDVSSRSEDIAENWLGRRVVFEPATIA